MLSAPSRAKNDKVLTLRVGQVLTRSVTSTIEVTHVHRRASHRNAMHLALPAGSVRATHTLLIVGLFCAMLLVPAKQLLPLPPYLIYLLFMVWAIILPIAAADADGSGRHPLYLPRGCIRFLVMVGLIATISLVHLQRPDKLEAAV